MTIHFLCASCQTPTKAEDRLAGRTLKCFTCGNLFVIPAAPPPPPPPPVPEPMPAPVAAFNPTPYEIEEAESDLFGAEAPVEAAAEGGDLFAAEAPVEAAVEPTAPEIMAEDDIDIAALLEEEPVEEYAAPAGGFEEATPGMNFEEMEASSFEPAAEAPGELELGLDDVIEEEPEPPKKKKKK